MLARDPANTSLNSLAVAAGVGVGTVYRHFPNTRVLLESIAVDAFAVLLERIRVLEVHSGGAAAFEEMIRTTFELLADDPGLAAVLAQPDFECADVHDIAIEFSGLVAAMIASARTVGALRPSITADDIRRLLNGLHTATQGLAPARRSEYVDVLLAGLRPPS